MTSTEPRTSPAWIIPVVAAVLALAVGVGGFFVASPFAAPRPAALQTVEVGVLPTVEAVSTIGAGLVGDDGAELATSTGVLVVTDPADDLRAAMGQALAEADDEATGTLPASDGAGAEPPVDTSGLTVLDPCPEAGAPDAECPTGARATVLKSIDLPALELWFSANDPTDECPARTTATSIALRVGTNVPAAIELWYEVRGLTRLQEYDVTATERAAWQSAAEAGELGWLAHCVELLDLPDAWSGVVTVRAVADDGTVVTRAPRFTADSALVVPPSWVRPIGRTAVMISVPAVDTDTVRLRAFAVPFGQPTPSCDFGDGVPNALTPVDVVQERFTRAQLEERGFIGTFVKRFTAGFVVPEASTVTLCAGTFPVSGEGGVLPDGIFSEVFYSPDLVLPVVRAAGFAPADGVRPVVELTADIGGADGAPCGRWSPGAPDGTTVCRYSFFDGGLGWDAALVVAVTGTGFDSTSTRTYALPISPRPCGLGCELPATEYVDVPVNSREPCIGNCAPSYLGTVRLQVDWEHGNRSWFDGWLREEAGAPDSDAPLLNTAASPQLAPLTEGQMTQLGSVRIETDVPTTMSLSVLRLGEGDRFERVDERVDDELRTARTVEFGPVPAGGGYYGLEVIVTDAEGNSSTYSATGAAARTWAGAFFRSDIPEVPTAVEVSITGPEGEPVAVGTTELLLGGGRWFERRDRVDEKWCTTGPVPFTAATATVFAREVTGFALTAQASTAPGPVDTPSLCLLRGAQPIEQFTGVIPFADLFTGVTVTVTNENGYVATIRMSPAS